LHDDLQCHPNGTGGMRATGNQRKEDNLYKVSALQMVRELGVQIQTMGTPWSKADVQVRTAVLTDFALARWPLWTAP